MNQPRPESRISALEKRASILEAQIGELASDTTEELKAIRRDIKQLDDGMRASFLQIGDAFDLNANNIEAVKQDLAAFKAAQDARFDKLEATQAEILALLKAK